MAKNSALLQDVETKYSLNKVPDIQVGDAVDVHVKVKEGSKERVQIFSGICIGVSGKGIRRTFTVRRLVGQYGVERKFPFQSPKLADVVVKKRGIIRRAKLFYLRDRLGKVARIAEKHGKGEGEGAAGEGGPTAAEHKAAKKVAKAQAREAALAGKA
ncbi:MAG TPA: 50S ribosomal protein L19 [Planctomycetota bacterium]|nr:50S ribosomal protein L19 [Planctomycetota bacterium]